jgi:hypothetical protein
VRVPESYRSYVVRVRRRDDAPDGLRADVEDILGGRRSALSGAAAEALADRLAAAVDEARDPTPPDGDEGREPRGA